MSAYTSEPNHHFQQPGASFLFQPEDEVEVVRMLRNHAYLRHLIGDTVPATLDLSSVHNVLDMACGVGSWAFDLARRYPAMHITGIDRSAYFIEKASLTAWSKHLTRVSFLVRDMRHLEQSHFAPQSFDLINIRFISGELAINEFQSLLQTLVQLVRPGGIIHWLEAELPVTNSPVCQQLLLLLLQALKAKGRAILPGTASLGITPLMGSWLRNADCRVLFDKIYSCELTDAATSSSLFSDSIAAFSYRLRSALLSTGVLNEVEFEELLQRVRKEVQAEAFSGIAYLRALTAARRSADDPPEPFRY